MKKFTLRYPVIYSLLLLAVIYLAVMILNDGFMATDEYFTGITRYIPAQTATLSTLVTPDDVKSPLQIMPMFGFAQVALKLGIENPYLQYRFVIFAVGIINLLLLMGAFLKFCQLFQHRLEEKNFTLLMLCFYFAAPFAFTRPMFESLAAPWLTWAGVFALSYDRNNKRSDLVGGVIAASIAFVLRQQLGLCAVTLVILPLLKKKWSDFFLASVIGLVFFVVSGIPDIYLRGKFHFSLLNITVYNFQHGADYGKSPIYFYPAMIFVMSFFPVFIARYDKGFLRQNLLRQRSLWLIIILFVFLHSLFSQKWERFLISIMPITLLIAEPYLFWLQERFQTYKKRLITVYTLNGLVFVIASFFPPQENLIGLSRYLNDHSEVINLYKIHDTPEWITDSFIRNKVYHFIDTTPEELSKVNWSDCHNALVVGIAHEDQVAALLPQLEFKATFPVNLLETLAYKLNPKNNVRRVRLNLYGCKADAGPRI